MRFTHQVALVTGAGSGIGLATALRFAQEGADIVIADLNLESAAQAAEQVQALGRRALATQADVRDYDACTRMVAESLDHFGKLDVVFANAGVGGGGLIQAMDVQEWMRVIQTNLSGVFFTCKAAVPALIEKKGGAIVTMGSSMAGWDTSETGAAYMSSKSGIVGLTKSLALQLARYNIRVNSICPGIIKTHLGWKPGMDEKTWDDYYVRFTQRIPLRRVGAPEDVAAAVAFLASDDARHITGSALLIDGGQTLQSWSNAPAADAYPSDLL